MIELLVALAVFSVAALALLNLAGENSRSAARVETRTLGGVVAENLAVEAMIAPRLPGGRTS
ncbi:MAG: type II secretion system protein GspI, partial [Brevundimonas sp.]|nr:type II secretion system protein GspI [Brevundimonas sp.]